MTINEEKQLRNYIEGLVREAWEPFDKWRDPVRQNILPPEEEEDDENEDDDDPIDDEDEIAGLDELRKLCEGFARNTAQEYLNEGKKKSSKKTTRKKDGKKKGSKGGQSSTEKTIMTKLNSDGVNAASYYYKLYGAKTKAEKAAARSKGYKKAKAKKNDSGVPYRFSTKEKNRLSSMLTDR